MNHDQARAFERLAAASADADDVRHALDALAEYDRLLTAATRELAASKSELVLRAAQTPNLAGTAAVPLAPAIQITTPAAAGS